MQRKFFFKSIEEQKRLGISRRKMLTISQEDFLLLMILCVLYIVIGVLALIRAWKLWQGPTKLSMAFYFFAAVVTHCLLRIMQLAIGSSAPQSNQRATMLTLLPLVSYQTSLYIYLRVWQLQCEAFDVQMVSHDVPKKYYVAAWYATWIVIISVDYGTMFWWGGYTLPYLSFLFDILNCYVIAFGFAYLGETIHMTMNSTFGLSSISFEQHVTRVKWFFGLGCVARGTVLILQAKYPHLLDSTPVFLGPAVYITVIEVLPLSLSMLSLYWLRQEEILSSGNNSPKASSRLSND